MNSIAASVRARGGLAATWELHADGFNRRYLSAAVRDATIVRVRQGWYSTPDLAPPLTRAARVGGRLSCLSGIGLHGAWEYPDPALHVSVTSNTCRLRSPSSMKRPLDADPRVRVHWRDHDAPGSRLLLSPLACLADVIRCQPAEVTLTAADSALHLGLITLQQWLNLLREAPAEQACLLTSADGRCESGTETLIKVRLSPYSLKLVPQSWIPGVGRVDFVVGERLVVEVDGAEYHTDPARFEADRRRDAALSRRGYRVLRFSYLQVMYRWPEVEAAILAAVFRGDHLA